MKPFELRNEIHRVDHDYLSQSAGEAEGKQRRLALVIGLLAICLAAGVYILDHIFPPACLRDSISHYFYSPIAGTFFIGALSFVAAFLLAYRGENKSDSRIASIAGVAALLVALFPTDGPGCDGRNVDMRLDMTVEAFSDQVVPFVFEGSERMYLEIESPDELVGGAGAAKVHWISAVVLFAVLFYFSAFVFTRVRDGIDRVDGRLTTAKKIRNTVYAATSFGMVVSFALIFFEERMSSWMDTPPVFIGEGLALVCFGMAWLVKGRFWLREL